MKNQNSIYSGAAPEEVAEDLAPLVDFQENGLSIEDLNKLIGNNLLPHLMRYDRPEFQSMFNSFPEKGAETGAKIALKYNQGVTNWQVSPGGAMLEELCCKALCRLFGFAKKSDATFMYSGTYANQQAVYLALHRYAEEKGFDYSKKGMCGFEDPSRLAVLISRDSHFSIKHAVRMLGLGEKSLITLEVDKNRRIDAEKMVKTISELQKTRGVFCVIATAGTTSAGSVDPIDRISDICRTIGSWLHVDGAYGFAYSLVPEWKHLFAGFEQADSVSWDPHKQLGVPIPNSLLFVRDKSDFGRMALHSGYFNIEGAKEPNPGLKSPPSTRPFAALSLVTSLRYQGIIKVIERLKAPLEAIRKTAEVLKNSDNIEFLHEPDTGIICFRIVPEGYSGEKLNDLQQYIFDRVMAEGKRSVSITTLDSVKALRLLAVSPAVTSEALLETVSVVKKLAADFVSSDKV